MEDEVFVQGSQRVPRACFIISMLSCEGARDVGGLGEGVLAYVLDEAFALGSRQLLLYVVWKYSSCAWNNNN